MRGQSHVNASNQKPQLPVTNASCLVGESTSQQVFSQSAGSQTNTTLSSAQNEKMIALCQIMISHSERNNPARQPELNVPSFNEWMGLITTSSPLSTADMMSA